MLVFVSRDSELDQNLSGDFRKKFSGGGPPDLFKGRVRKGNGGEEREGKGKGRREGKDREGRGGTGSK